MNSLKRVSLLSVLWANGRITPVFSIHLATKVCLRVYKALGVRFSGTPNYISTRTTLDGTDYSLIQIGEGVTISSYIRLLTHDWALYTVAKALGYMPDKPVGRVAGITIGDYSFVGTGSVIMPGTTIGRGCLIGAGTVVRGHIPDYSIVVGSPCEIIGDTRDFVRRNVERGVLPHSEDKVVSTNRDKHANYPGAKVGK